jgi:hypothetical protein
MGWDGLRVGVGVGGRDAAQLWDSRNPARTPDLTLIPTPVSRPSAFCVHFAFGDTEARGVTRLGRSGT